MQAAPWESLARSLSGTGSRPSVRTRFWLLRIHYLVSPQKLACSRLGRKKKSDLLLNKYRFINSNVYEDLGAFSLPFHCCFEMSVEIKCNVVLC